MEAIQVEDEKVYLCFQCSNMLVGKTCYRHHAGTCCKLPSTVWKWYKPLAEHKTAINQCRWIDCSTCDLQLCYKQQLLRTVTVISRWVRFAIRLVSRTRSKAALRTLRTQSLFQDNVADLILALVA